jgi:CelD/BcsL family acetyltransferase involved in cellulose biosynthesis
MAASTTRDTFLAPVNAGKLEYRIYSNLSEIAGIGRQWDDLLKLSSCNRAFGSLEWYLASCRLQSSLKPYLVTAARGPECICVLPLALDLQNGLAIFPHLENDYNDALVRGHDPATVARLLQYALFEGTACRRIRLAKIRPDSQCTKAAALLDSNPHIEYRSHDMKLYRFISLPPTFDQYLSSRGKLFRRNVRRALRNDDENGLVIREVHPQDLHPQQLPEVFLQLILDRHRTKCAFDDPQTRSFVREVLPALFRRGSLRAFAMLDQKRIVAIDLYLSAWDGLVAWNGGFSAAVKHRSPGTALIAFAIQQAIAMRLEDLDFGEGEEAYKQNWSNNSYMIRELDIIKR